MADLDQKAVEEATRHLRHAARAVADDIDEFGRTFDESLHTLDNALERWGTLLAAPPSDAPLLEATALLRQATTALAEISAAADRALTISHLSPFAVVGDLGDRAERALQSIKTATGGTNG